MHLSDLVPIVTQVAIAAIASFGAAYGAWCAWPAVTMGAAALLREYPILVSTIFAHAVIVADFYPRYALAQIRMGFVGQKSGAHAALSSRN